MILEIGSGIHHRPEADITIDKSPHGKPNIVRDVARRGIPFTDETFDEVYSMDIIEHIEHYEDLIFFFNEVYRVLKPGGLWKFTTPLGLAGLADHLTHHRAFTKESFSYLLPEFESNVEYMRLADGIIARFEQEFIMGTGLYGIFKKA